MHLPGLGLAAQLCPGSGCPDPANRGSDSGSMGLFTLTLVAGALSPAPAVPPLAEDLVYGVHEALVAAQEPAPIQPVLEDALGGGRQ